MYLCYLDESGDSGYQNSPTKAFSLGCLMVEDRAWLLALDGIVGFRRFLRARFGLKMRDELKAQFLIHNTGPFLELGLGDDIRMDIFKMALKLIPKLNEGRGVYAFGVVVDKDKMIKDGRGNENPQIEAWERVIERLERFTYYKADTCILFPDEGEFLAIRKLLRGKRRHCLVPAHYGGSPLARPAISILEDPSMRKSSSSYYIQLADLLAYSAHRAKFPLINFNEKYWEYVGDARLQAITKVAGGQHVGIKEWPP